MASYSPGLWGTCSLLHTLRKFVVHAGAALVLASGCTKGSSEELGQRVVEREVIMESGRVVTIYETITLGSTPPQTIAIARHKPETALASHEDAILQQCQESHGDDEEAVDTCVEKQTIALQRLTAAAQSTRGDAGLANIIHNCMSESGIDQTYDWPAVMSCYAAQRQAFAELYGR